MKRSEYLERAFKLYNEGKIDENTYDAMLLNIDAFCEEELICSKN